MVLKLRNVLLLIIVLFVTSTALYAGNKNAPLTLEDYISKLDSVDEPIRMEAATAISKRKDAHTVERIILLLKNKDSALRFYASWILGTIGDIGDKRAVDPLIVALLDPDEDVRRISAWSVGMMYDKRAVNPLIDRLADTSSAVRVNAAFSLGELVDARAYLPLTRLLQDPVSEVVQEAILALGKLDKPSAVSLLKAFMKDPNPEVRKATVIALSLMSGSQRVDNMIIAMQDSDAEVVIVAVEGVTYLEEVKTIKPLRKLLGHSDKRVRAKAAAALAQYDNL